MLEDLRADVRYTLKWLLRSPVFTGVAVASLALGIGFNTALFSIVDAMLLRPLPVERPERLADVYTRGIDGDTYATSSYPDFLDFQSQNRVFYGMMGYSPAICAIRTSDQSRMAIGEVVTGNYFQLLGVRALLGRTLLPEDDRPGAARVMMIAHRVWMKSYGGDPGVIGKSVHMRGQVYTIVGVVPERFTGMVPMLQPEIWVPVAWVEEIEPAGIQDSVPSPTGNTRLERRGQRWLFIRGRLKDGETARTAEANLRVIMGQLETSYKATNQGRTVSVVGNVRLHPQADKALRPIAIGLMLGVGLVLLVACANVTNMLLARASSRQREIGVRLAIGASRGRLIRQLLTESVVLALAGAAAGIALAGLLLRLIQSMPMPITIPIELALRIDERVLIFTTVVATLAGLIAGLAPAFRATRTSLVSDLKGGALALAGSRRRWTLRNVLVAGQTAVTLVLLVAAGLLTRSIFEARKIDLGFRTTGVAALAAEVGLVGYDEKRATQFFDRAIERVRAIPGVQSATRATRQPLAINYNRNRIFLPERHRPGDEGALVAVTWVDSEYFETIGVPVLRGRRFGTADSMTSTRVAIVNDAFVRTYWPGSDPLGRRFRTIGLQGTEFEVVGVVGDYKVETVGEPPTPYIHYALTQRTSSHVVLIARAATDSSALLAAMKREVLALEPHTVFIEGQPMDTQVDAALLPARLAAQTASIVGLIATVLAAIGLYGVIAYAVARRTREIGIRMALGAARGRVIRMVMRQGMSVAATGLVAGLLLAWLGARAVAGVLYGVGALDPAAWLAAVALSIASAAAANFIPAWRASQVDPSIALRTE
jgi:predicted permease